MIHKMVGEGGGKETNSKVDLMWVLDDDGSHEYSLGMVALVIEPTHH